MQVDQSFQSLSYWEYFNTMQTFATVGLFISGLDISTTVAVDPFPKRHRLVHNGGFPKLEALYCSLDMVSANEIP